MGFGLELVDEEPPFVLEPEPEREQEPTSNLGGPFLGAEDAHDADDGVACPGEEDAADAADAVSPLNAPDMRAKEYGGRS